MQKLSLSISLSKDYKTNCVYIQVLAKPAELFEESNCISGR